MSIGTAKCSSAIVSSNVCSAMVKVQHSVFGAVVVVAAAAAGATVRADIDDGFVGELCHFGKPA